MIRLSRGDCLALLPTIPPGSVDACVTDPPYALDFMGHAWDRGLPGVEHWRGVYAALKPGGYLLAFGGTRTFHRQTCAIEDAGFQIRDCINVLGWVYGTGFPKGKGCLKPSWEPVTLARKPGPRVLPLNIDAARVSGAPKPTVNPAFGSPTGRIYGMKCGPERNGVVSAPPGRWPPNVCLVHHPDCRPLGPVKVNGSGKRGAPSAGKYRADKGAAGWRVPNGTTGYADASGLELVQAWDCVPGCPAGELGAQSGPSASSGHNKPGAARGSTHCYASDAYTQAMRRTEWRGVADRGTAARFFPQFYYGPKASRRERGPTNDHPTVKPLGLTRWLVRLVSWPGQTILDPFAGSGTTLIAAQSEGRSAVGFERNPGYFLAARARIKAAASITVSA